MCYVRGVLVPQFVYDVVHVNACLKYDDVYVLLFIVDCEWGGGVAYCLLILCC